MLRHANSSCHSGVQLHMNHILLMSQPSMLMPIDHVQMCGRYLPKDAEWVEGGADCGTWKCKEGFVPSISGYSCISLALLSARSLPFFVCHVCVIFE
jgi:hypothetical protein